MYGGGNGGGPAVGGAGAVGITQLPDTGGPGQMFLALLTPDSMVGVLFLVMALWALIAAVVAVFRIIPRSEEG